MKRLLIISLVVVMVIATAGCSTGISQEDYDELKAKLDDLRDEYDEQSDELEDAYDEIETLKAEAVPVEAAEPDDTAAEDDGATASDAGSSDIKPPSGAFDADEVIAQLETTSYVINGDYSSYAVLVVKNNSAFDIHIDVTALFYDEEGSMIGTSSENTYAFESGQETAFNFWNEDPISDVEFEYWVEEESYYNTVLSSLSKEVSTTDDKAMLSVTNNGDVPALFVQYVAVFFKDGEAVYSEWGYCVDDNSEIAPGKTQREEVTSYEKFDTVQVYLAGYAD